MEITFETNPFLSTHVRKGLETMPKYKGLVSIRSNTVEHAIKDNKPLLITLGTSDEVMLLNPSDMISKVVFETDRKYPSNTGLYSIMRFKWEPIPRDSVILLSELYLLKTTFDKQYEALKQRIIQTQEEYDKSRS